jgi:hypothetical protein
MAGPFTGRLPTNVLPPNVLAVHTGERWRQGEPTGQPSLVVTVGTKMRIDALDPKHDLTNLFGANNVDVQAATPLQLLFASPAQFGVGDETLALVEERLGFPFAPQAQFHTRALVEYAALRKPREFSYTPPTGISLGPLTGTMRLTCHAGPDAGWKELKPFLAATTKSLTVGMFDLTAPHIGDALIAGLSDAQRFDLVLDKKENVGDDGPKARDRTDAEHVQMFEQAFGSRFASAFAFTKSSGATFSNDYHIKLAVRDRVAFWMSSGSWQSSNQPPLDPLGADAGNPLIDQYNREWHVIGEHAQLAEIWEAFLQWDLKVAQQPHPTVPSSDLMALAAFELFRPLPTFPYATFVAPKTFEVDASRVQALLTPDNYIEAATALVADAKSSLLVQNQGLSFLKDPADQDPRYTKFTKLLAKQSQELPDFRMIVRDPREFGGSLEALVQTYAAKGFKMERMRFQPLCHNKGIVADGAKVMIGSHNISNGGLTSNRDASLIVADARIAAYFAPLFEHDWAQIKQQKARPAPVIASPLAFAPAGMTRVSLAALLNDA